MTRINNNAVQPVAAERPIAAEALTVEPVQEAETWTTAVLGIPEADVYAAVREFILTYALPKLSPEQVLQGWQNRAALPEGTEDYVLMSVISATPQGTAVERFFAPARESDVTDGSDAHDVQNSPDTPEPQEGPEASDSQETPAAPGRLEISRLMRVAVRVEFCSADDSARLRAQRFAAVARSSVGAQFFHDRPNNPPGGRMPSGMSPLYVDELREHTFRGEAAQFVRRYECVLHLSLWSGDSVEMPYFDKASLSRLENVEIHHGTM